MLTTLDRVKRALQWPVNDTSEDDTLLPYILAASEAIEKFCGRKFKLQEHTEKLSSRGSKRLILSQHPVQSVNGLTGPQGDIPSESYEIIPEGILFSPNGWPAGERHITVTYKAGYVLPEEEESDLPKSVDLACAMLAKMMVTGEWGKANERFGGGYSVQYLTFESSHLSLPPVVQALLGPFVDVGRLI